MNQSARSVCVLLAISLLVRPCSALAASLFDGKSLAGWEGNPALWRVENGAITGGSLVTTVKNNDFLCSTRAFTNFHLRLTFKLTGTDGFINSGIQIRSQRVPNSHEVAGYQCDLGDPDWWGAIYDEARRNRVLIPTDMIAVNQVLRRGDWNSYAIRADGPRITIWLNDLQITDYYEDDPAIPEHGIIGIQVHGGGKALIQIKDITVENLPPTGARFVGAPPPAKPAKPSPLTPNEAKAAFSLPPGFEIELVASEEQGVTKPITVAWDAKGKMWAMTAVEYPVDANDNKEIAEALYRQPRRDKVLVFDNPYGPGPHTPSVFAEGFAIPLGLLPYRDGAYLQHGSEILFLRDTNGDGRADRRETVLAGFGIGDSHLLPHQFTRMPGGWIWFAQGAFNNSRVRTTTGETFEFNRTLMGRFTPEGDRFETIGWGPCNIWGMVMNDEGEVFIQEANDYGYPVMPFHIGAFYPGCTPAPKPYAPTFPGLARLGMGGTGLSGLALSDTQGSFPGAYGNVFFVANPVKQRIQAVKLFRQNAHYSLLKLPDFVISSDEWFRPVAIHFGPDGCLYIVDWCNRVISHNEVPRDHSDRDKHRGRIWRVRHSAQKRQPVPDFTRMSEPELRSQLGSERLWNGHMAWQQIIDRGGRDAKSLAMVVSQARHRTAARVQALWALEGLKLATAELLEPLLTDTNRNLRREAVRVLAKVDERFLKRQTIVQRLMDDPDPEVRAELIRTAARTPAGVEVLIAMVHPALSDPLARNTQNGKPIKVREAYDRDFERYLIRAALEKFPTETAAHLERAKGLPVENRLLAALALEPKRSASLVAQLLPELDRAPNEEELLRLAEHLNEPGVSEALKVVLQHRKMRRSAAEALLAGRTRLDTAQLTPLMEDAAVQLLSEDPELAVRLGSGFKLKKLEEPLLALLETPQRQLSVLRALRELGSTRADRFASLVTTSKDKDVRREALLALSSTPAHLLALWPQLDSAQRRAALDQLASSRAGAEAILSYGSAEKANLKLDVPVLEKMLAVLGDDPRLGSLLESMGSTVRSALRLDGKKESYVASNITLKGPFTVETWIRLDPGISNEDGILGRPGGADFNFADGRFRIYGGPESGDRIIAKRRMTADLWTHIAVTREENGKFRIYIDGELETYESQPLKDTFDNLQIGRVSPPKGTAGLITEYRIWNDCRSPEAIRADFDRSYEGEPLPKGLIHYFPGGGPWGTLNGNARVVRTLDSPPLLTTQEAKAHSEKLTKFRTLAESKGDISRGKQLATACLACHIIQGEGANIGPNLSGAGAMNLEALLRSLLTPNAAMEAGYRIFRVELETDDVIDGFLVSQDSAAVVLRVPNSEDRRIPRNEIRRANFVRRSLMPEGLLESFPDKDAADLLSYLRSLK